jgi:hypothetical protein
LNTLLDEPVTLNVTVQDASEASVTPHVVLVTDRAELADEDLVIVTPVVLVSVTVKLFKDVPLANTCPPNVIEPMALRAEPLSELTPTWTLWYIAVNAEASVPLPVNVTVAGAGNPE